MNIYWITKINNKKFYKTSRTEVSKALRERGHNVTLVIERNIGEKPISDENFIHIPTIPCRIISRFLFGLILFLCFPFMIRRKNIDVILIDGANVWMPFVLPLKFLNIPIILDIRTLSTDKEKSMETVFYDTSLFLSKYIAKGLTTITPELKDILSKKYHITKEIIGIWTSGASKEFLSKTKDINRSIIHSIDSECIYLMYHGTYEHTRGIETLIESIAELNNSLKKKIKLMIIGLSKTKRNDLKDLSRTLNISENIDFIPPVDYQEIPSYIDACHVGVIPLPPDYVWWHVSAPMKTLEYLARGKPIIATNIPFHQGIFDKGTCGILLKSSDKKALTEAITKMYDDKNQLKKMGERGKEIVEKYYTWNNSAEKLEKFIKKIITEGK